MNVETRHDPGVTDAQFEAAAEATRVDGGRAHFAPHDEAGAYKEYLYWHARERAYLYRIRREYMGEVALP